MFNCRMQFSLLQKEKRVCCRTPASLRQYSSNEDERISRYPVPYKKNLPYDIVELMEEVGAKVRHLLSVLCCLL